MRDKRVKALCLAIEDVHFINSRTSVRKTLRPQGPTMEIVCCLTGSDTVYTGTCTDLSQCHATSINMSLSRYSHCVLWDDKINTLYFKNNLRRLYQIPPVSVAQSLQEHLRFPSEYKFPFSSLRSVARKIPCTKILSKRILIKQLLARCCLDQTVSWSHLLLGNKSLLFLACSVHIISVIFNYGRQLAKNWLISVTCQHANIVSRLT
jgi:hypothetical protein